MMAGIEKPCNMRITAITGGLEPAVNPPLHARDLASSEASDAAVHTLLVGLGPGG
jgi:hypothetical protein